MAAGRGARNEGGRGGGRGEASRQSRRQQGLPPEEVADLDVIQKAARKAKAEQRKAALLEKEAAAEGQSAPEPPIREDAHQATSDGHSHEEVEPEGESGLDEPAKTSEGGVNEEVSQAESRVSDSPLPGQDDQGERAVLEDKPLSTVLEEATSQDGQDPADLGAKPSPDEADQEGRDEVPTRRETPSKRRQNEPPWPVSPVMSIDDVAVSESLLGSMSSRQESSTMSGLSGPAQVSTADPVPHSVGTSGESMGAASGSYASRNSSASSLERVTAGIGALAMSAQAVGGDMSGGVGLYVTKEVVPYPETGPDEDVTVKLEQVGRHSSKTRQARRQRTRSGRDSSSSGDSSDSDARRRRRHARSRRRSPRRRTREPSSSGYSTRSRHSHRSGRSGRSSSSVSSGLAEVAVSTFNQVQRMNEVLARLDEKLPSTGASPNQDGEVQRMLAEAVQRAREAEWRAQEAERRLIEAPVRSGPDPVKVDPAPEEKMIVEDAPAKEPVDVEAVIQAAVIQAAQAERARVEAAAEDFIRQQQAEADARHEAERAAWAEETQRNLAVMQQKLEALEVARVQEKEAATNMQRFQAERIRTLQATPVAQAQPDRATIAPESATPVKTEVNHPDRATRIGGAIKRNVISGDTGNATQDVTKPGLKNLSEVAIAQLRATLPDVDFSRLARGLTQNRAPADASAAIPTPKAAQASATRTETSQRAPRQQEVKKEPKRDPAKDPGKESKKPERKRSSKRPRDNDDPPADPDPDPDSDGGGGDSDDSYDSLDEDLEAAAAGRPAVAAGSTILTVHPYVNSQLLAKFDEKAARGDRRDWWEQFMNLASQGGWTDQVRLRELKMKMSLPVRNWRGQLSKHVQQDWTRLSTEFVKKYLKSRTSDSDRYYTMKQKSNENAMEFFYRLNEAAVKAGVRYKKSKKECAQHIKCFIKNLKNAQLKAILGNQRFRSLEDLEYVLQQDEDLNLNEGYESSPSKGRDFRADNVPPERFKKRPGRAYVGLSDGDADSDSETHVRFNDDVEEVQPSSLEATTSARTAADRITTTATTQNTISEQDLHNAVYRAMEQSGWRPAPARDSQPGWQSPRPGWQSPRRENPDKNTFFENCKKFGHKEEKCWKDVVCEQCGQTGHPDFACRVAPCKFCNKYHGPKCEDFETMKKLKALAQADKLSDLPAPLLAKLLDGKANPRESLN